MNKERLAELLNGREYGEEITPEQEEVAKECGLVAIFGYSDDNVELRGAINDEIGAYNGCNFIIEKTGKCIATVDQVEEMLDDSDIEDDTKTLLNKIYKEYIDKNSTEVIASYDEDGYSWIIKTDCEHSEFEIMEEGEKFCKGIVIDLKDL